MKIYKSSEFWLGVVVLLLFAAGMIKAAVPAANYQKIADTLSSRLRSDLADDSLKLEIVRTGNMPVAKDREDLFGDAYLVSSRSGERKHIYFEAVINTENSRVTTVDYEFLDNDRDINTGFLEKLLIKRLGKDFRTREVVFGLDEIHRTGVTGGAEKFSGTGETRIGSFEWKKVRFEITLNKDSETVSYRLEEM